MNRRRNSPLARWGFSLVDRRCRQILALGVGLQGQWGSRRSLLEHKGTVLHTASDAGLECRVISAPFGSAAQPLVSQSMGVFPNFTEAAVRTSTQLGFGAAFGPDA